jgi:hypothetical protein
MEKKKRGRPAKKKTETKTEAVEDHCETFDTLIVSEPIKKDKQYFKNKLETLADEITIAIKEDRSLAIRLKSVYVSINQAAKKL